MPKAQDRLPSQRKPLEEREEDVSNTALRAELKELRRQLTKAQQYGASRKKKVEELSSAPKVPVPKAARKIKKISSTTRFHVHVEELCVFLRAFDAADIAPLIVSALRKLGGELKVDMLTSVLWSVCFMTLCTHSRHRKMQSGHPATVYTPIIIYIRGVAVQSPIMQCAVARRTHSLTHTWLTHTAAHTYRRARLTPSLSGPGRRPRR